MTLSSGHTSSLTAESLTAKPISRVECQDPPNRTLQYLLCLVYKGSELFLLFIGAASFFFFFFISTFIFPLPASFDRDRYGIDCQKSSFPSVEGNSPLNNYSINDTPLRRFSCERFSRLVSSCDRCLVTPGFTSRRVQ